MSENKHTPEPLALYWANLFDNLLMVGARTVAAELRRLHEIEKQLYLALPFVEDHLGDPAYKAGVVQSAIAKIRKTIDAVADIRPPVQNEASAETTVPAIVFFPAGSLGEPIDDIPLPQCDDANMGATMARIINANPAEI